MPFKLIFMSFYALLASCDSTGNLTPDLEPKGKALFDPENRTMLGYKLYDKIDDIETNPKFTLLKKEDDVYYYTVNTVKKDTRQLSLVVSVRNKKVYSVESKYQYPDFKSCNNASEQIYTESKTAFPLEKRPNVNDKGYHFDGVLKNYIFITACTDLLEPNKIIHSTTYMR